MKIPYLRELVNSALLGGFADADSQGFHFAVEVAAFEAEGFGGTAHVAVAVVDFAEDVFALVGVAGLLEGGEFPSGAGAGLVDEGRQVLAFDAQDTGSTTRPGARRTGTR